MAVQRDNRVRTSSESPDTVATAAMRSQMQLLCKAALYMRHSAACSRAPPARIEVAPGLLAPGLAAAGPRVPEPSQPSPGSLKASSYKVGMASMVLRRNWFSGLPSAQYCPFCGGQPAMPSGNPPETDSTRHSPVRSRHPGRAASAAAAGALAPPAAAGCEAGEPRVGVAAGLTPMAEAATGLDSLPPGHETTDTVRGLAETQPTTLLPGAQRLCMHCLQAVALPIYKAAENNSVVPNRQGSSSSGD
ncbi:MAG: hypothetical protein FRX49_10097 [Trebouxia sp. A1-2]|nr:MAG: hypothetical protein FRX49_10097 [Trebouxia sp. A1-2]